MKRLSRAITLSLFLIMLVTGCSILPKEEEFDTAPLVKSYAGNGYSKYTVTRGDMIDKESLSVTYQGTAMSEICGEADGGKIKAVQVQKGDRVKKGDVLVCLYMEEEEEALKEAKRQVASLQLQMKQAKQMKNRELEQLEKTGGSKEEKKNVRSQCEAQIRSLQSTLQLTELEMKELEESIQSAVITADMSGTVVTADHSYDDGGYANAGDILVTIQGEKRNRFVCKTKYASQYHKGERVVVTSMGNQYKTTVAKVTKDRIWLSRKGKSVLKDGAKGTIELIKKEKRNVIYLPSALIFEMGDKKVVYMEGKNGVKEVREIQVGETIQNYVEITGGLEENEQVIMN